MIFRIDSAYDYSVRDSVRWSHVCRQWRDVVTSISALWDRADLTLGCMLPTALNRCNFGPITINLSCDTSNDMSITSLEKMVPSRMTALQPRLDRIKDVSIRGGQNAAACALFSMQGQLPSVVDFSVEVFPEDFLPKHAVLFWTQPSEPPWLPSIKKLELNAIIFPLSSGVYQNLTRLTLINQWTDYELPMTILVEMLEQSPKLRFLNLQYPGPRLPEDTEVDDDNPPSRVIKLPHLEVFILKDGIFDVGHLLAHICLSRSTKLTILTDNKSTVRSYEMMRAIIPGYEKTFPYFAKATSFKYVREDDSLVEFSVGNLKIEFNLDVGRCEVKDVDGYDAVCRFHGFP
jgi:hypothetical protein